MGNPMALITFTVDDLEGFKSRSGKLKAALATEPLHVGYWYIYWQKCSACPARSKGGMSFDLG